SVRKGRTVRPGQFGLGQHAPAVPAEGIPRGGTGEERDRLEPGDDLLLLGDRGDRETAWGVGVAQPDNVEEELLLGRGLDGLVVPQPVAFDRPGTKCAPRTPEGAPREGEQEVPAGNGHGDATSGAERTGYIDRAGHGDEGKYVDESVPRSPSVGHAVTRRRNLHVRPL